MTEIEQSIKKDLQEKLESIRRDLSRVHHDANNPLSVISGNVELLGELARALGTENEFNGPIEDMAKAIGLLSENIDRLIVVRKQLTDLAEQLSDS